MSQPRSNGGRLHRYLGGSIPAACFLALLAPGARADEPGEIKYNRDVRPILSANCFACHGPDSGSRKANLRLDRREAALAAEVITPGDPESSELMARIASEDPLEVMPPPGSHKSLTAEQKDILHRWVAQGAEYQQHWSFLAPTSPEPPAAADAAWSKSPIDRFLLAGIEAKGLKPAPEADRRTLARRLSLDLTGLPPAPAEVDAFVADPDPVAYERYVDKLMASPRWGEHRARYWLDAARYADTHGIHIDNYREIWAYRRWVIDAFNANMPFDQFTLEQLAGDLLPARTLDQQIASGFNRCNITTSEGGAIDEEYAVLYTRERTETVSQVWMGLTTGCAVCHDHKYDPFSQREFYELSAFFNNTTQAAMDGNIKDTPPIVFVPADADRTRVAPLAAELADATHAVSERKLAARPEFEAWLANPATPAALGAMIPAEGLKLAAFAGERSPEAKPSRAILEVAESGDFEKDQPFSAAAWVRPAMDGANGAVIARMDDQKGHRGWDLWMEGGRVGSHIINDWPANAMKVVSTEAIKGGVWSHVLLTYDGSGKAAGMKIYINGVAKATTVAADALTGTIRTEVPLKVGTRAISAPLTGAVFHDVRTYARALAADEVNRLANAGLALDLAAAAPAARQAVDLDLAFEWYVATLDAPSKDLRTRLAGVQAEDAALKARGSMTHVMDEKPGEAMAYILSRGEYSKRLDPVKPKTPEVLPPMPPDFPRNRLGLAKWLLLPEHPLTARVTVNRLWQELFGTGLVATSGDFGITGEVPPNPALLDWLAVDFRENGWDVKRFYKQLVTSAAYRQAAVATPEDVEKDPGNRLISRGPRFRMDAEMVRDYALATSGLLVEKLGGPSVKPYQPDGVWEAVAMPNSNTYGYQRDAGENLYRRSLYTFWKRSAPPASMDILNAPSREVCTVRRERTNTPLQALVTLNDPQFVEAARELAGRALKDGGSSTEERIEYLAGKLLARSFRPDEAPIVAASLDSLLAHYREHPEAAAALLAVGESKADPALDPPTLAAWTMLANELLNLDEVLNK